jgi:hypothetical protein
VIIDTIQEKCAIKNGDKIKIEKEILDEDENGEENQEIAEIDENGNPDGNPDGNPEENGDGNGDGNPEENGDGNPENQEEQQQPEIVQNETINPNLTPTILDSFNKVPNIIGKPPDLSKINMTQNPLFNSGQKGGKSKKRTTRKIKNQKP